MHGEETKLSTQNENIFAEPEWLEFRDPETAADIERFDDAIEGSRPGIRIESPTSPATRAVSSVQIVSLTVTAFDLCQQRLVIA